MSKNYSRREVIGTLGAAALATSVVALPTVDAEGVSLPQVRRVTSYRLGWNVGQQRRGAIILNLENPAPPAIIRVASPQELSAILAILKEEPVYYNSSTGWLRTGAEEIG